MFAPELKERLAREVAKALARTEELYKRIHANPELSCQEEKTAALMAQEMRAMGLEVHTGLGGHGLAGVLANGEGPCVLLRADMDALPLRELTGLEYASQAMGAGPDG